MSVNFINKTKIVSKVGTAVFERLRRIPQDIRPDDATKRPGMEILLRVINTRELLNVSIYEPSPFAK
ncbi:MAG: hypothetical protein NT085_00220, partial [candidate division SR1 bacterium]|nr:hypothetical protein [candidate division SR1 bacterium]